ncbi:MAG: hypothetical protein NT040_04600 [Bacteroidetes bacterium]|nr:hypothetical protein [Bacteroidota bacterium]
MKPKHLIACLILLVFTSCVTIVKWRYGITKPRELTPEKIISFLDRHKYPGSCQFVFNDSSSYFGSIRNTVFRKNLFSNLVFDRDGFLLQRDTSRCQWSGYEVIRTLSTDSTYMKTSGLQLGGILGQIRPVKPDSMQEPVTGHPDFTVLVTWAAFLGTCNARLFELAEAVKQNKTARIRTIWLNVDMQESWNLTKEQKMELN